MAYNPTDLKSTFQEAVDRFNGKNNGNNGDYDGLGKLLDPYVEMGEVDDPPQGPPAKHSQSGPVVQYLKNSQTSKQPRFDPGSVTSWNVAGATLKRGIITGSGNYNDDSIKGTGKNGPVVYAFVFERDTPTGNWLLKSGYAAFK